MVVCTDVVAGGVFIHAGHPPEAFAFLVDRGGTALAFRVVGDELLDPAAYAHNACADALDLGGGEIREVDVIIGAEGHGEVVHNPYEYSGEEAFHRPEIGVGAVGVQRDSDGGDAVQGRFLGSSEGAGVAGGGAGVGAVVDAAHDHVGLAVGVAEVQGVFDAAGGGCVQIDPLHAVIVHAKVLGAHLLLSKGNSHSHSGLGELGGHYRHFAECAHHSREDLHSFRPVTVVVGNQNSHKLF